MAKIEVNKVKNADGANIPLLEELRQIFVEVERRAFDLFQRREGASGHALDDWLQAERETRPTPPTELVETSKGFAIRMMIPGFAAKEVQVTATPHAVIVKAAHPPTASQEQEEEDRQIRWSELPGYAMVCRSVPLPESIAIDTISATLADGVLLIRALKAAEPRREIGIGKGA